MLTAVVHCKAHLPRKFDEVSKAQHSYLPSRRSVRMRIIIRPPVNSYFYYLAAEAVAAQSGEDAESTNCNIHRVYTEVQKPVQVFEI
jgi:hypothetical protein